MPALKSKKSTAAAPAAEQVSEAKLLYPQLMVNGILIPEEKTIITAEKARAILQWEDEDAYAIRVGEAAGSVKLADPLLVDENGKRVMCWANTKNRPFSEPWCRQLAQDILAGNWHLNLETIVISATGQVTSGQHRLIGLVLAAQIWAKDPARYPVWNAEPTIRALIAFGGSDDQKVLNTIDNTRPQAPSDAFFRSDIFKDKSSVERKELSRLLDVSIDLLWKRTGYGNGRFQTVSESVLFEQRHDRLVKAVEHVFIENKERALSLLGLSAGHCAAMLYLAAAAESDGDKYRRANPPSQEAITMSLWNKARDFFSSIAKPNGGLGAVRDVLAKIQDKVAGGTTGSNTEKIAVLAAAFDLYREGKKVTKDALDMRQYYLKKNETTKLSDMVPNFRGIDKGHDPEDDDDDKVVESEDARKRRLAEEKKQRAAELSKKVEEAKAQAATTPQKSVADVANEMVADMNKKFPGRFLMFKHKTAGYVVYGDPAKKVAKIIGTEAVDDNGLAKLLISDAAWKTALPKLLAAKLKVAVIERVKVADKATEEIKCRDLFEPAPKANGKPVTRK